jgi:signal transduction histidine kinase
MGLRRNFIPILVFSVLGAVVLTFAVFVYQSRGLRHLLVGLRRLGEENFKPLAEGSGEFGRLARALNSTAESLQEKKAELVRVHAEVEQGRKLAAVGRLAAGVAHEVNNPLATISTYAQLLLRRTDLPPDAAGDLRTVMDEIRRIQEKLRNLLDLSRMEDPVRAPVDPSELLQEVVGLARHAAAAREIELHLELERHAPPALLDRSGMKQVIWNLLGNAIDCQGPGGEVVLRTRFEQRPGDGFAWVLEVEDRGPGVPQETREKIFEPFFTTKEVGQGTGLGLAVAYSIVRSHGGKIELEDALPTGALFRVLIPNEAGS